MRDFDGGRGGTTARIWGDGGDAASRDERERRRDRWRFLVVFGGAIIGGLVSFGIVEATMGWLPDPGPMIPFSTFAGGLLGLFSAAFVAAQLLGDEEREDVETPEAVPLEARDVMVERPEVLVALSAREGSRESFNDDLALPSWVLDVHRRGLVRRLPRAAA